MRTHVRHVRAGAVLLRASEVWSTVPRLNHIEVRAGQAAAQHEYPQAVAVPDAFPFTHSLLRRPGPEQC